MSGDFREAILARLKELEGPHQNEEYTALCPFSPEGNHRLTVDFGADTYDCPHCYSHGPVSRLAQVLGIDSVTSLNPGRVTSPTNVARLPRDPKKILSQSHQEVLRGGSGISDEVIAERGYRTISAGQGKEYGFAPGQCRSGLLMPVWAPDGTNPLCVLRPDRPRLGVGGKALKYEMPRGQSVRLDCPPRCKSMMADPNITLWVTEGIKKSDALATHGLCAIALLGVWNFKGTNDKGGVTVLADFDCVALNGRQVNICFDSDVMTKPQVRAALDRLTEHLQRRGAHVTAVYLPQSNGAKVGVDDYLLTHSVADLEGLVESPRPVAKPAAPLIELLDEQPPSLTRPLQLVDGHGYAAAWLWVKTTVTERLDTGTGNIVRLDCPVKRTERRLFIVRDDGTVFGDGGRPMEELGLQVAMAMPPKATKLWTAKGVKAYRNGYRPEARKVFSQLVALIDHFMSFDRSLADQKTMAELVACYALVTWLLDAFHVVGYLWPNGTLGTGKTKLGMLVCEIAYLGEVLLSGSTNACLRDLADLGATLLFDDAEGLSDPKKTDPDKRNLLLAGNRRGSVVVVKEAGPNGTWKTRYVNTFCPRLFTAIRLPDPVLASRTIIIPLVRTADARKANSELLDYGQWPCSQRQLLDDLWAVALASLSSLPSHEAAVNADAPLFGRTLEPWRALLAVAHWLDELGEVGLYGRMADLAKAYQTERADLEPVDLTRMVVRALLELA
ncbi:MAG: DUF3854 domain-containing protein, partial [Dehalococcoidia bacterium]|nr:DUF3854 domain-containing protein [Dehalococcoidia bacterium]